MSGPGFAILAGLILLALAGAWFLVERKWPGKLRELVGKVVKR